MAHLATVGPYRIDTPIGIGGFASVYRAWDDRLGGEVAIKVLADNHSLDEGVRRRFISEGQLLRRVDSPHVIRVFDVGETERQQPYLVLEYADRGDLEARLADLRARGYQPDSRATLALVTVLGGALGALHTEQLVHRDVTPRNLLLRSTSTHRDDGAAPVINADERLMLADLGFAKDLAASSGLTVAGGTTGFSAPEQRSGGVVDRRADLYAATAIVVWFLTGAAPEAAARWVGALRELGHRGELVAALKQGLAIDPDDRQADAATWLEELTAALGVSEGPVEVPPRARWRIGVVSAVLVGAAVLGGLWFGSGDGVQVQDLGDGTVSVSREVAGNTVTLAGPAEATVGETVRYTTSPVGLVTWTWIGPDGRIHPLVPAIDIVLQSAGTVTVRLVATTVAGDTVELEHRFVVTESRS